MNLFDNKWHTFSIPIKEAPFYPTLQMALKAYSKKKNNKDYEIVLDDDLYFIKKKGIN